MENKKSNTGLIVTIVVLVMLLLFGGTLLLLSSMGYLSFDANNVKEEEKNENDDVKEDDENSEIEIPKVEEQENENHESQEVTIDDFKISFIDEIYTDENNNGLVKLKNVRNLPVIESKKYMNSADKIVNYLKEVSDVYWKQAKYDMNSYRNSQNSKNIGINLNFSISRLLYRYVSFELIEYGGMGGVSWVSEVGYVFDIEIGDVLDFSSICVDESKKDNFYNYVINTIAGDPHYHLDENWKDVVKKDMFEIGNWYFTNVGVRFTFQKYSLGPGSNGVITVEMPYSEANQYLKNDYKG